MSGNSFEFLPVVMEKEVFSIGVKALFGDIEAGMVLNLNLIEEVSEQKLLSKSFVCRTKNEITGEIAGSIPSKKTGYLVTAAVLAADRSTLHSDSQEYRIEDETDLLTIKVNAPISKTAQSQITVINHIKSAGDYFFSDNATYINQRQEHVLDLFLPVEAMLTANPDYVIDTISDYRLTMTDSNGNSYLHCGNRIFNQVILASDQKHAAVRFSKEWKNHILCGGYDGAQTMMGLSFSITADMKYTGKNKDRKGIRRIHWSTACMERSPFLPVRLAWNEKDCDMIKS